ncbi:hypothetical protein WKK05_13380 [Nostoc sp. UHCC 0302]|uniref:hypothetical protein n=1 Tax=Nostoc sp. UHCC 0302 TaxID=3134896 RepID=UPI00311CC7CB
MTNYKGIPPEDLIWAVKHFSYCALKLYSYAWAVHPSQNQSEQALQEPSRTPQKFLTISFEEIVRSNSSTQNENTQGEETAIAPFGGAPPQALESMEENKEELPVVTDCTSLALVDAVQGQSALLLGENQDCGVEPKDCHEGTFSAAPVAPNF